MSEIQNQYILIKSSIKRHGVFCFPPLPPLGQASDSFMFLHEWEGTGPGARLKLPVCIFLCQAPPHLLSSFPHPSRWLHYTQKMGFKSTPCPCSATTGLNLFGLPLTSKPTFSLSFTSCICQPLQQNSLSHTFFQGTTQVPWNLRSSHEHSAALAGKWEASKGQVIINRSGYPFLLTAVRIS